MVDHTCINDDWLSLGWGADIHVSEVRTVPRVEWSHKGVNCVCMRVYVCMCMHVCVCVCVCACVHVCDWERERVCVCVCVCLGEGEYVCVCACVFWKTRWKNNEKRRKEWELKKGQEKKWFSWFGEVCSMHSMSTTLHCCDQHNYHSESLSSILFLISHSFLLILLMFFTFIFFLCSYRFFSTLLISTLPSSRYAHLHGLPPSSSSSRYLECSCVRNM